MLGLLVQGSCCTLRPIALLADLVLKEPKHPFVPFLLESFQDLYPNALCDDRVVDRMIGDEFEMSEGPVE